MRICLPLHRNKNVIFANLKFICIDLPQELPRFPGREPGPLAHLQSLVSIVQLAATLPATLPMRNDLQSLATKALDAVVADFGDDVQFHKEDVVPTAYAK